MAPPALATSEVDAVQDHLRRSDVPAALDAARAGVAARPDDVEAHELLIDVMMTVGLGPQVTPAYEVLVAQDASAAMSWYLLGRAVLDVERARAAYERALDLDPAYARAWMGLGSLDRALGNYETSVVEYRKALGMDAALPEAWSGLADALILMDQREEALAECQKAMAAVPEDPDAYLIAARLLPDMDTTYLGKGARAAPDEPRLHAALGQAQLLDGDLELARDSYARALELNPSSPQLSLDLMLAEDMLAGRLDETGRDMIDQARDLLGSGGGDADAARRALDMAADDHPNCALIYLMRGPLRVGLGEPEGAQADLERAYALRPDSPDAQGALGLLHLHAARFDQALPLLQAASAARPQDAALALAAAQATGGVEGARAGLDAIAAVATRFPFDARPALALATLLSDLGQPQAAYDVLSQAAAIYPEATLIVALAGAARDVGRDAEAAALLERLGEATGEATFSRAAGTLRGVDD